MWQLQKSRMSMSSTGQAISQGRSQYLCPTTKAVLRTGTNGPKSPPSCSCFVSFFLGWEKHFAIKYFSRQLQPCSSVRVLPKKWTVTSLHSPVTSLLDSSSVQIPPSASKGWERHLWVMGILGRLYLSGCSAASS